MLYRRGRECPGWRGYFGRTFAADSEFWVGKIVFAHAFCVWVLCCGFGCEHNKKYARKCRRISFLAITSEWTILLLLIKAQIAGFVSRLTSFLKVRYYLGLCLVCFRWWQTLYVHYFILDNPNPSSLSHSKSMACKGLVVLYSFPDEPCCNFDHGNADLQGNEDPFKKWSRSRVRIKIRLRAHAMFALTWQLKNMKNKTSRKGDCSCTYLIAAGSDWAV